MKWLLLAVLALTSTTSFSQDRESLLKAWENIQRQHSEVAKFDTSETPGEYTIKFEQIPFEGNLRVLVYGVEEFPDIYGGGITKTGYVEVELVGMASEELTKYGRPYYKWLQSNSLFFDNSAQLWISAEEYSQLQHELAESAMPSNTKMFFWEYSNYILVAIVLYFFITSFGNNKKMKLSIEAQKRAEEKINESIKTQHVALEEAKQQTELLREIRDSLAKGMHNEGKHT
ncbi:hypothetical protein LZ24_02748 [Desulfobotulus alkaliphilus]|uniref:Uncharacterized protein n=1 Tax=Desulfobotulus alkaliphilus TaxID=622671 RepID=A0A562RFM7_9BACT|nr:hypothetical protein [Desulfobotulus alkaliphilus]TWI67216.1 hypothetical protein LZ24_02748 [Desulfobotulus alkaliphilus]